MHNIVNENEVRNMLIAYLKENPMSLSKFAKTSGISRESIRKFMVENKSVRLDCLLKIHKFLTK